MKKIFFKILIICFAICLIFVVCTACNGTEIQIDKGKTSQEQVVGGNETDNKPAQDTPETSETPAQDKPDTPATPTHNHFYNATTVEPTCTDTCTDKGYTLYKCSCGDEYKDKYIAALGHIKGDVKVKNLVKASDSGYGYYTEEVSCKSCNQVISSKTITIQPNGATTNGTQSEWEKNTVLSNVPYPQNGECVSLVTSTENTAVGNYKGTVGAIFEDITLTQVKTYTQTLKNNGYNKNVSEQNNAAYSFTAYHNSLNLYIAVGYDGAEIGIAVYKTGTVKKASSSGGGASGSAVINDITATAGLTYALSSDKKSYSVTGYNGTEDYVVIPFKYNGLPVKSINGFNGSETVKAVIILADIMSIEESAFEECENLIHVSLPDGITSIGDSAFWNCYSLVSVTIPDSVTEIGKEAFADCSSLASVTIGNSVERIGDIAFRGCQSLKDISIPDRITNIGSSVFNDCDSLKFNEYENGLYLGNNNNPYVILVKAKSNGISSFATHSNTRIIYDRAFFKCSVLRSVTISDTVKSIGANAFQSCSLLTSLRIPYGVTSIGDSAFSSCSALENVTIPDSVKSIGNSAFSLCTSLERLNVPDSVEQIPMYMCYGCTSLMSINIGSGVKSIGFYAFKNCESLYTINFNGSVQSWGKIEKGTWWYDGVPTQYVNCNGNYVSIK